MYSLCHDDNLWRKLLYADFQSVPPPTPSLPNTAANNTIAIIGKRAKSIVTPCTNLKLYQNHLKLGHRWLTGKVSTRFLQGHSDSVYCLAWIDQDTLVSGSRDKTLKVWDVNASRCIRTVENEHEGSILCICVSKDRSILLTGSSDSTCAVWSLPDLVPIRKLRGHEHSVLDVCFVSGKRIVTASKDSTLRVWSQETGQELLQMVGHSNSVNAVEAVGEDRVVSVSGDATMKLWNISTGECIRTMQGHNLGLACARYNGKHLYSGGLEGKIKVWDVESGECISTLVGHVGMIRSLDYIEGKIISGSYDRTVKVWDANTGACLLSFQSGHSNWIYHVLSSGTRIVSSGQERRIMVIDFGKGLTPLCPL
ncbi:WD40-repeat-containing domain protein [Parasitella parasitica]|nr:WD40-repeat-containing domain protein [Parasitella parasitica]